MPTVYFKSYAATPPSGGNLIPWVSIDGGTFTMRSERPTLISAASGWYKLDLSISVVSWETILIRIQEGFNGPFSETIPDIIVEADHVTDLTPLETLTSQILGLAGHFSVTNNTLTTYDDAGVATGTYALTRNSGGEITAIEPVVSNNGD